MVGKWWKLIKEVAAWFKKSKQSFEPNLIKGDFDGDAKPDFAVLIQQGVDANSLPNIFGVVFLKSATGYTSIKLEGSDGDFISFEKKGTKNLDIEKNKSFVLKTDAIFVGIWEKGGISYMWKNGKFVGIVTSD